MITEVANLRSSLSQKEVRLMEELFKVSACCKDIFCCHDFSVFLHALFAIMNQNVDYLTVLTGHCTQQ